MRTNIALLIFIAIGCCPLACTRPAEKVVADVPVFIVSIDTLRSDRLNVYGYSKGSTPAIDAFRKDAILFEHAFSHCPQTLPSHVSLLSGYLPPSHGVRDNVGYVVDTSKLAFLSTLKANGYRLGAGVSSYVLRRSTGLATMFDFYDDEMDLQPWNRITLSERSGDRTLAALQSWIDQSPSGRIFAMMHLYEPHAPYTPRVQRSGVDPYDGEISDADSVFGSFIDYLKKKGLYDQSVIVLLSDHGEGLGEHGEDEHGIFVYRESLQVPLLIKLPGAREGGTKISRIAGITDVAPTVLNLLEIPVPPAIEGVDLRSPERDGGGRRIYAESYFGRLHFGWHELISVLDDEQHYIHAPKPELYLYRKDPGELLNVANENRRAVSALAAEASATNRSFMGPKSVDPEDQRKLAALGYIGSSNAGSGVLPDPKDRIGSARSFRRALSEFEKGNDGEAIRILDACLSEDPAMADAWGLRAQCYWRLGQRDRAIDSLKTAMQRFPNNSHVALGLGEMYFLTGRMREARDHAQLAVADSPVTARELLARISLAEGDLELATREISAALEASPARVATLMEAASLAAKKKNPAAVIEYLTRAKKSIDEKHLPPVKGLELLLSDALLETGDVGGAEAALRAETTAFPTNLEAWGKLAVILGAQGRRPEARAVLTQAIRSAADRRKATAMAKEALELMGDREGLKE